MKTNRNLLAIVVVSLLSFAAAPSFAVGIDFSVLTSGVDFSTVGTGILAIGALMMAPKVVSWGARKVMGFIRG